MLRTLAFPYLTTAPRVASLAAAILLGSLQGCAAQTATQIWESRQDSVQQTGRAAGPRSQESEARARALLQRFRVFLLSDGIFDPERAVQGLGLEIAQRSGRFRSTSPEYLAFRPTGQDTPVTGASLILKPEAGRVFRGSELRIFLSSERFGCITLADMEAVFSSGYEAVHGLPLPPGWPREIPVDVALYRVDEQPRRAMSFSFHFVDCLASIQIQEILQQ